MFASSSFPPSPTQAQALSLASACRLPGGGAQVDTWFMNRRQRYWTPRTKAAYAQARAERSARPLLALLDAVGGGGGEEGEEEEGGDMCKMALERMVAEEEEEEAKEGWWGKEGHTQQHQQQQKRNKKKKVARGV